MVKLLIILLLLIFNFNSYNSISELNRETTKPPCQFTPATNPSTKSPCHPITKIERLINKHSLDLFSAFEIISLLDALYSKSALSFYFNIHYKDTFSPYFNTVQNIINQREYLLGLLKDILATQKNEVKIFDSIYTKISTKGKTLKKEDKIALSDLEIELSNYIKSEKKAYINLLEKFFPEPKSIKNLNHNILSNNSSRIYMKLWTLFIHDKNIVQDEENFFTEFYSLCVLDKKNKSMPFFRINKKIIKQITNSIPSFIRNINNRCEILKDVINNILQEQEKMLDDTLSNIKNQLLFILPYIESDAKYLNPPALNNEKDHKEIIQLSDKKDILIYLLNSIDLIIRRNFKEFPEAPKKFNKFINIITSNILEASSYFSEKIIIRKDFSDFYNWMDMINELEFNPDTPKALSPSTTLLSSLKYNMPPH